MTPKEKAKKLVNKFLEGMPYGSLRDFNDAKQCALILINDKIDYIKSLEISDMMKHDLVAEQMLIKQEIEKL